MRGVDPAVTTPGTIVGTVQYMAPEQLKGRNADSRSDIFAFGVVLFEMLTGAKPFPGDNQLGVGAAILDREPVPLRTLVASAPAALERVVSRCLAKDPTSGGRARAIWQASCTGSRRRRPARRRTAAAAIGIMANTNACRRARGGRGSAAVVAIGGRWLTPAPAAPERQSTS